MTMPGVVVRLVAMLPMTTRQRDVVAEIVGGGGVLGHVVAYWGCHGVMVLCGGCEIKCGRRTTINAVICHLVATLPTATTWHLVQVLANGRRDMDLPGLKTTNDESVIICHHVTVGDVAPMGGLDNVAGAPSIGDMALPCRCYYGSYKATDVVAAIGIKDGEAMGSSWW
jgi:hypothetical protein